MLYLVFLFAGISPNSAAPETPFGTTANGGFDINSISSFLDDDGSSSKIEFPTGPGKGGSFSYFNYPATGPGNPYKPQPPPYPVYPTALGPAYSLKPGPTQTQFPTAAPSPPSSTYVTPPPYQPVTKGQVLSDNVVKGTVTGQAYFPQQSAPQDAYGTYRPPNKNYILGDPSQKHTNVFSQLGLANQGSSSTHGTYRPPNKNYVLGDPSLNKGHVPETPFFPQNQQGISSSPISNFGGVTPQNFPSTSLNSHHSLGIGSSTPSYDQNNFNTGSHATGFGSQQGGFNIPHKDTGANSFTQAGTPTTNNPSGHINGQVNSFKYPVNNPSGFGASGSGGQNFGHHISAGGGQPVKYGGAVNFIAPTQNHQSGPVRHPAQFGGHGFGGFATNYLIPSKNYGNQPGKYSPSVRYPSNQVGLGQPGAYGSSGAHYPAGAGQGVNNFPGHYKLVSPYKTGIGFDPSRFRRGPPKFAAAPYRGPVAQASSYKPSPYIEPSPFSIFEDMMLL